MDWRSVNFDWNRARAFLVTAEEGSLSSAAKALNMTQPTVGRQVRALEQELGVALFERGSRGLELTPSGVDLLQHVRAMGGAATQLSLSATGRSHNIEGSVCISAMEVVAAYLLPPVIRKLRTAEPGIEIELIASNSTSDLRRREADIALRGFRPTQPDLIARKLFDMSWHLYGAHDYLEQLGNPSTVEELSNASFIAFNRDQEFPRLLASRGVELSSKNFPVIAEHHVLHWELVKQGVGIGGMQEEIGDAEPAVRRALPSFEPFEGETWLVTHRELRTSRRVRAVYDFLAAELVSAAEWL
ncbi:MAG: LysR family transcriptional regulator [Woeseiaceae bacterium]